MYICTNILHTGMHIYMGICYIVQQSSIRFSKTENIFAWRQAFSVLQVSFHRSEVKMFSHYMYECMYLCIYVGMQTWIYLCIHTHSWENISLQT